MDRFGKIIADKWNEHSVDFDEKHATEDLAKWKEVLKELLGGDEKAAVLDVGTGTGFLALMIAELGYKSYGIDFAQEMLALGEQHAAQREVQVDFRLGEAEELPYADHTFAAVVNSRVLWTLLDPAKAFQEWKRVLKPGGSVLCFTRIQEKKASAEENNSVYDNETESKLPLKYANEKELANALAEAGFKEAEAVLLPQELTFAEDMKPWYVIRGIK